MIYIPVVANLQVKKENAKAKALKQRKVSGLIFFLLAAVELVIYFLIHPKLLSIFSVFEMDIPWQIQLFPLKALIFASSMLFVGSYFLFTKSTSHEKKIDRVLKNYKKGDLINMYTLMDTNLIIVLVLTMIVSFASSYYLLITPLYFISDIV